MAEESFQEKTEQATPKRREDARRKGQVARSSELSSIAILATALLALSGLGPYMFDQLGVFMIDALTNGMKVEINSTNLYLHTGSWVLGYARIIGPIVALLVVVALGINYAQVGVLFTLSLIHI